jgi:hypothetical protein
MYLRCPVHQEHWTLAPEPAPGATSGPEARPPIRWRLWSVALGASLDPSRRELVLTFHQPGGPGPMAEYRMSRREARILAYDLLGKAAFLAPDDDAV